MEQELAARVAAAWAEYRYASECGGTPQTPMKLHKTYRALADELEQATGQRVVCGRVSEAKLTGRPGAITPIPRLSTLIYARTRQPGYSTNEYCRVRIKHQGGSRARARAFVKRFFGRLA